MGYRCLDMLESCGDTARLAFGTESGLDEPMLVRINFITHLTRSLLSFSININDITIKISDL